MTGLFRDAGGLDYKIFHLINFIEIRLAGHEGQFLFATVRDVQPVHVLGNTMLGIYFEFVDSDMINLLGASTTSVIFVIRLRCLTAMPASLSRRMLYPVSIVAAM